MEARILSPVDGENRVRGARKLILTVLAVLFAAIGTGVGAARAQQYPAPTVPTPQPVTAPPPPVTAPLIPPPVPPPAPTTFASGLQVIAYPYLWLAGLNMAITTPLARAPQVNISAGAGEIISDINYMPFMGGGELRYGPFGILADGLHIPLGVPITTPRGILFSGGSSAVVLNVATGDFLYRLFERPGQTIDGGLGFRWWGASADTTLVGRGPLPSPSVSEFGKLGRSADRRPLSCRFWPRVWADCLWRCRRLRDRRAFRLADLRHARLCLEPITLVSRRLPQP